MSAIMPAMLTLGLVLGPGVLVVAGVCLGVGLVLLHRGMRGRIIDDHPICNTCKFDLVGIFPDSGICPECGEELSTVGGELFERAAVVFGTRKRRPALINAGVALLIPAILILSAAATLAVTGRDLAYYKPTRLLTSELSSRSIATADAAARELQRRIDTNGIAADKVPAIIDAALDRQASGDRLWAPEVGDLIEAAIGSGGASVEQHHRYLRSTVAQWSIETQSSLHTGDWLTMQIVRDENVRVGVGAMVNLVFGLTSATLDGKPVELIEIPISPTNPNPMATVESVGLERWSTWTGQMAQRTRFVLPPIEGEPGEHLLALTYDFMALENLGDSVPVYAWTMEMKATIEIRPPDVALVDLVPAPSPLLANRVHDSIQFEGLSGQWSGRIIDDPHGEIYLPWTARFFDTPMDFAFDILIAQDGNEWLIGSLKRGKGSRGGKGGYGRIPIGEGPTIKSGKVDIILRPNPDLAIQWPSMTEIWGEDVVLKGLFYSAPLD